MDERQTGIQVSGYRGATRISTPGEVVLHLDELHDGQAGAVMGVGNRLFFIEPAQIFEAAREVADRWGALPCVQLPARRDPVLAAVIRGAFVSGLEPLAADVLILRITMSLIETNSSRRASLSPRARDVAAMTRALADKALGTGFVHQVRFTRMFTAASGLAPGRYRASGARWRGARGRDGRRGRADGRKGDWLVDAGHGRRVLRDPRRSGPGPDHR
jgi:hypothetical protein